MDKVSESARKSVPIQQVQDIGLDQTTPRVCSRPDPFGTPSGTKDTTNDESRWSVSEQRFLELFFGKDLVLRTRQRRKLKQRKLIVGNVAGSGSNSRANSASKRRPGSPRKDVRVSTSEGRENAMGVNANLGSLASMPLHTSSMDSTTRTTLMTPPSQPASSKVTFDLTSNIQYEFIPFPPKPDTLSSEDENSEVEEAVQAVINRQQNRVVKTPDHRRFTLASRSGANGSKGLEVSTPVKILRPRTAELTPKQKERLEKFRELDTIAFIKPPPSKRQVLKESMVPQLGLRLVAEKEKEKDKGEMETDAFLNWKENQDGSKSRAVTGSTAKPTTAVPDPPVISQNIKRLRIPKSLQKSIQDPKNTIGLENQQAGGRILIRNIFRLYSLPKVPRVGGRITPRPSSGLNQKLNTGNGVKPHGLLSRLGDVGRSRQRQADIVDIDDHDDDNQEKSIVVGTDQLAVAAEGFQPKTEAGVRFQQEPGSISPTQFSPLVYESDESDEDSDDGGFSEKEDDEIWGATILQRRKTLADAHMRPKTVRPKSSERRQKMERTMRKEMENDFFKPLGHIFPLDFFMDQEEIQLWSSKLLTKQSNDTEELCYGIVPSKKPFAHLDSNSITHTPHPTHTWTLCTLSKFNPSTNQFTVIWQHPTPSPTNPSTQQKHSFPRASAVSRVNLRFPHESKSKHLKALHDSKKIRMEFEKRVAISEMTGMLKSFVVKALPVFDSKRVGQIWEGVVGEWSMNLELHPEVKTGGVLRIEQIDGVWYEVLQDLLFEYEWSQTKAAVLFCEELKRLRCKEWLDAVGGRQREAPQVLESWHDVGHGGSDGGTKKGWWWDVNIEVGLVKKMVQKIGRKLCVFKSQSVQDRLWTLIVKVEDLMSTCMISKQEMERVGSNLGSEWDIFLQKVMKGEVRIPVLDMEEALLTDRERKERQEAQQRKKNARSRLDSVSSKHGGYHQYKGHYRHRSSCSTDIERNVAPKPMKDVQPVPFQSEYFGYEPFSLRETKVSMALDEAVSVALYVLQKLKAVVSVDIPTLGKSTFEDINSSASLSTTVNNESELNDDNYQSKEEFIIKTLIQSLCTSVAKPIFAQKAMNLIRLFRDGHVYIRLDINFANPLSKFDQAKITSSPSLDSVQKTLIKLFDRWMDPVPIRIFDEQSLDHAPTVHLILKKDDNLHHNQHDHGSPSLHGHGHTLTAHPNSNAPKDTIDEPEVHSTIPETYRALSSLFAEQIIEATESAQAFILDRERAVQQWIDKTKDVKTWGRMEDRRAVIQSFQRQMESSVVFVKNETRGNMIVMDVGKAVDALKLWVDEHKRRCIAELKGSTLDAIRSMRQKVVTRESDDEEIAVSVEIANLVSEALKNLDILESVFVEWTLNETTDILKFTGWAKSLGIIQ
ncbi:hypothetical protein HDV05_007154 [Chytridiales sp. JEL 0842]|nr:hypothetical protein HDV05_007154 [Chytridiales sp. JEL 0842]